MAIWLEFYNIIMPIKVIEGKYPGGFPAYKADHIHLFLPASEGQQPFCWHDDHLCRVDGAMAGDRLSSLIDDLKSIMDIQVLETVNGCQQFKDVYVTGQYLGSNYPCNWIETDSGFVRMSNSATGDTISYPCEYAYMKGTEPGIIQPFGLPVDPWIV